MSQPVIKSIDEILGDDDEEEIPMKKEIEDEKMEEEKVELTRDEPIEEVSMSQQHNIKIPIPPSFRTLIWELKLDGSYFPLHFTDLVYELEKNELVIAFKNVTLKCKS
jgi:hypothetical protein